MSTVLITGGAGFIGSHTADLLLKKDYQVRVLDNLSETTHFGKWPDYLDNRIEKIKGDVTSKDDLANALKGVDYVIHLAAFMDLVPQFEKFVDTNIRSTALIYELIVVNKLPIKKVVIASSQFVYGEGRWYCSRHGEVFPQERKVPDLKKEKWDPVCPVAGEKISSKPNLESHQNPPNQYAISKYTQELIGIKLGRLYNIPTVALRYSIVHGPRQSFKNAYSGALRIFALEMLAGRKPPAYEDGESLRDYVSVYDVGSANVLVMENKKADFEVFNVGGGKAYSVIDLGKIVAKSLGVNIKPAIVGEFRLGDIRHAISDISKLKKLGWQPKLLEEKAVADYVNWLKHQNTAKDYVSISRENLSQMGTLIKVEKR